MANEIKDIIGHSKDIISVEGSKDEILDKLHQAALVEIKNIEEKENYQIFFYCVSI